MLQNRFKLIFYQQLKYSIRKSYYSSFLHSTIKQTLETSPINQNISVQGWVQAVRKHKHLYFVDLIDRTCFERLQILIDSNHHRCPSYGSSIKVEGSVVKSSHKGQNIELIADSWTLLGSCSDDYPFQYQQIYSSEFVRSRLHLRPRTRRFSSLLRVRNRATMAVHKFFQDEGFCFIHTPIITQNDCEGAGEVFTIAPKHKSKSIENVELSEDESEAEITANCDNEHFFNVPAYLTVSGQLHLEAMACALTRVYNFGPTFRAENARTRSHSNEFQMIEAEIAFVQTVADLCNIVEKCIKFVTESILNSQREEFDFVCKDVKNHESYISSFLSKPFVQMSYDEAVSILNENRSKLQVPIQHGEDLGTEHKKFLVNHCKNIPLFVYNFPATIKAFYMKTNDKNEALCFDLFAPFGGEICGGSIREEDEEALKKKYTFDENDNLQWYLELRKYGTVPHGGFGIGFDRLLQSILGIPNIRDIIPFPRRKYDCKC